MCTLYFSNGILYYLNNIEADATRKISLRSPAEGEEMRSAIKYLQDLDDFYSQIARPR